MLALPDKTAQESLDAFFEEHVDRPCRQSQHPAHQDCGRPATYGIEFIDLDHDRPHSTEMCSRHVAGYLRLIAQGAWCPCVTQHRTCRYGRTTLKNLL